MDFGVLILEILLFGFIAVLVGGIVWFIVLFFFIDPAKERKREAEYRETEYYKITGRPREQLRTSNGSQNEFDIYNELKDLKGYKKFLFNCWIPSTGKKASTEMDVLMLHSTGCYLFESKDYKARIVGDILADYWTQELGRQDNPTINEFYNPVKQNKLHLDSLQRVFPQLENKIISCVVFSNRSTLKITSKELINMISNALIITKTNRIRECIEHRVDGPAVLSDTEIDYIYNKLLPCCKRIGPA